MHKKGASKWGKIRRGPSFKEVRYALGQLIRSTWVVDTVLEVSVTLSHDLYYNYIDWSRDRSSCSMAVS